MPVVFKTLKPLQTNYINTVRNNLYNDKQTNNIFIINSIDACWKT